MARPLDVRLQELLIVMKRREDFINQLRVKYEHLETKAQTLKNKLEVQRQKEEVTPQ